VFVEAFRAAEVLLGLKSGLVPGAREGNAVTLGRNAEEEVADGNEIGRLYRCFKAL
jgi:hypothetical protein